MRRKSYRGPPPPHIKRVSDLNFSEQAYRGYLIRVNALTGDMWIEKGGVLVHRVPPSESWAYARKQIDELVGPRESNPGRRSVHTAKFDRCVTAVRRKGYAKDPYAVCSSALPHAGVKKAHRRTTNPPPRGRVPPQLRPYLFKKGHRPKRRRR